MLRQCGASKYNRCKVPEGITLTDDNFHKGSSEWLNHRFFKRCNYCQDTNVHFSNPLQPQPPSLTAKCSNCGCQRLLQHFLNERGNFSYKSSELRIGEVMSTCNISSQCRARRPGQPANTPVAPIRTRDIGQLSPSPHRVRSRRRFTPPSSPTIEPVPLRRSHRARRRPAHFDSSPHDAEPKMCRKCEATKPLNEFSHEGSVLHSFCNACCLDLVEESRLRRIRGMPDSESSGLHDHVLTIDDDNDLESPLNHFREQQPALIQSVPLRPPISPV